MTIEDLIELKNNADIVFKNGNVEKNLKFEGGNWYTNDLCSVEPEKQITIDDIDITKTIGKKLLVEFTRINNVVVSEIIWQDESLWDREGQEDKIHGEYNGCAIHTRGYNSMYEKDFYLKSYQDIDRTNITKCFSFNNAIEAQEWTENIEFLIDRINGVTEKITTMIEFRDWLKRKELQYDPKDEKYPIYKFNSSGSSNEYFDHERILKEYNVDIKLEGVFYDE